MICSFKCVLNNCQAGHKIQKLSISIKQHLQNIPDDINLHSKEGIKVWITPSASIYSKGQWKGQRILLVVIRMNPKDRQIIGGFMQKGDILNRTNTPDFLSHWLTNRWTVKWWSSKQSTLVNLFVWGFFISLEFLLFFTFNYHGTFDHIPQSMKTFFRLIVLVRIRC